MNFVVLDWNWKNRCKLVFNIYTDAEIQMCVRGSQYVYMFPSSVC